MIHSFWIPNFLFKLDVVPGRVNMYEVTPDKLGTYIGECAELCGVEHSRMLFNVKVVSPADYQAHIQQLITQKQGGTLTTGCGTNDTLVGTDLTTTGSGIRCVVGPMTSVRARTQWRRRVMTAVNDPAVHAVPSVTATALGRRDRPSSSGSRPPTTRPSASCT